MLVEDFEMQIQMCMENFTKHRKLFDLQNNVELTVLTFIIIVQEASWKLSG